MENEKFVLLAQLPEIGIPKATWPHLRKQVEAGTFPPPVRLSKRRLAWRLSELEKWKATRPAPDEPLPVLWPPRKWRPDPTRSRCGRPRGSRVINGKLVRPEQLVAPRRDPADAA